jgi:hypothetical protein
LQCQSTYSILPSKLLVMYSRCRSFGPEPKIQFVTTLFPRTEPLHCAPVARLCLCGRQARHSKGSDPMLRYSSTCHELRGNRVSEFRELSIKGPRLTPSSSIVKPSGPELPKLLPDGTTTKANRFCRSAHVVRVSWGGGRLTLMLYSHDEEVLCEGTGSANFEN